MKVAKGAAAALLILSSSGVCVAAEIVAPTKAEVEAMYTAAAHELSTGSYSETLKQLDAIEARQPNLALVKNLRGVTLMRLGEYRLAEKALQKARELDPHFWEARFNLAEAAFLQKNWAVARDRFEALLKEGEEQTKGATGDLIKFKIALTYLLQKKERQAAEIADQLKDSSISPAYYCTETALAFHHGDETGARVNLRAAEKGFPAQQNQLFFESFYELGWMEKPDGSTPVTLEVVSKAGRVASARTDFEKARRAYQRGDEEQALELLHKVEDIAPNQAVTYNLHGEILLDEGKIADAEAAFRNALVANPELTEARYNLARISFKEQDYEKARKELEPLLGATSGDKEEQQLEKLIRYQIYLALLLEGRDGPAQKAMEDFKMTDDTPALYYAQAAWAFQHGNSGQAKNWIANAENLFSPELNRSFAAPLNDLDWLPGAKTPARSTVAAVDEARPAPSAAPSPKAAIEEERPPERPPKTTEPAAAEEEPEKSEAVATPTPEAAKPKKGSARREKAAPREKKSRTRSRHKETAEVKKRETEEIEIRRAQPVLRPQAERAVPGIVAMPEPPVRENLGDKVRNFFLYPFRQREQEPANTAPVGPKSRPTPTPGRPQ